jgi:hypothetical protein
VSDLDSLGPDAAVRQSLERAVAALGPGGPLPVVVVSDAYATLLDNWIAHVHALGITRFLVVAMDEALANRLSGRSIVVATAHFDGSETDFWLRRMLIWRCLSEMGVDIVQSDIDAIWLRDPVPEFFADQPFDLLCTQGTFHPFDTASAWGFVLCTGLMGIRAGAASVRFFGAFAQRHRQILETDDQVVMNHVLDETGLRWETAGMQREMVDFDGSQFATYASMLTGFSIPLGMRVGLLPYKLFPRLPMATGAPFVKHLLRPEDDAYRIAELRAEGCWLLGP